MNVRKQEPFEAARHPQVVRVPSESRSFWMSAMNFPLSLMILIADQEKFVVNSVIQPVLIVRWAMSP